MTKREEVLTKLLRATWECLPGVLAEDCLLETDIDGLADLADAVSVALNAKRVNWKSFDSHERSIRAKKGWRNRRSKKPELKLLGGAP